MVVMESWPLLSVENPRYRRMSKHDFKISYKLLSAVIFLLGELVVEILTKLLRNYKGIGIHDGFTRGCIHYICIYVAFIADEGKENDEDCEGHRLIVALLGVSPTTAIQGYIELEDEDELVDADGEVDESDPKFSASFDAKHMSHHFNTILEGYGHSIESFLIAMLADNTNVNKRCAKDNDIPHLPCLNHTHALDIGEHV